MRSAFQRRAVNEKMGVLGAGQFEHVASIDYGVARVLMRAQGADKALHCREHKNESRRTKENEHCPEHGIGVLPYRPAKLA